MLGLGKPSSFKQSFAPQKTSNYEKLPTSYKQPSGFGQAKGLRVNSKPPMSKTIGKSSKGHRIIFTEPITFDPTSSFYSPPFIVSDDMYKKLLEKPKEERKGFTNAYIFGRKFPPHQYKLIASHTNDAAQTGIV